MTTKPLPAKTELVDVYPNPSTGVFKAGLGKLWEWANAWGTADNCSITGGAINGTTVGATAPASGSFTTLSASGNVTLGDASTDTLNVGNGGLIKDAAGNVGIGVTPSSWDSSIKAIENAAGAYAGYNSAGTLASMFYTNCYSSAGDKYKTSARAGKFQYDTYSGSFVWYIAPSGIPGNPITWNQAMTLDASGNLLVGTTSAGFQNSNSAYISPSSGAFIGQHASGMGSGVAYAYFNYAGGPIGSITQSGTTAVAYNTTSDHRLKNNVRPADANRFNEIEFVDFEWIDGRHDCGVIAHKLQAIYPDLVIGEKDATEIRSVEIKPAVPAVTEQRLVSEAVIDDDGDEVVPAVYETEVIKPAVEAVYEDQEFPVYQQVNYIGLIGRMGVHVQKQAKLIAALEERLAALEAKAV